jgi:hypothetical protein
MDAPLPHRSNQSMARLFRSARSAAPTGLPVVPPSDACEREADLAAEAVLRMTKPLGPRPELGRAEAPALRAKCEKCEEEELRREAAGEGPAVAPPAVHAVLASPGRPLDAGARAFFEPRFGADLSAVRVHDDPDAAASAEAVGARAYTVGNAVVFNAGEFSATTPEGQRLLAHELAHVVQQLPNSTPRLQRKVVCDPENADVCWEEADSDTSPVAAGLAAPQLTPPTTQGPWSPGFSPDGTPVLQDAEFAAPEAAPAVETAEAVEATEAVETVEAAEAIEGAGFLGGIGTALAGIGAGLAAFFYSTPTAPAWMDEINPITHAPYRNKEEYDRVRRMTPEEIRQAQAAPGTAVATGSKTGNCTAERHRELQDEVDRDCKVLPRACDEDQDCQELKRNRFRNERCAASRDKINKECFGGGDRGHRQAAAEARKAAEKCAEFYRRKKC